MFNGMLGSNKNPNQNRYIRLIALSAAQIFFTLPVTVFSLYFNAHYLTVHPWISWDDTHSNYYVVNQIPSFMWRANPISQTLLELNRWTIVIAAFLFFAFFGFAEEARRNYRKAYSFASSSLRLPDFGKSRGNTCPPYTPSRSNGQGIKKGMATILSFKGGFSALGSRSKSETTTERKDSFVVSEYRLTSNASIFGGIDNAPKAFDDLPGDDDSQLAPAPASQNAVRVMPAASNLPVPPPPIARVSVRSLPPGLYPAFPHSPTDSDLYLDPHETV